MHSCWRSRTGTRCFFFQAEDGIRDLTVTGVQTCALPICFDQHEEEVADVRENDPAPHGGGHGEDPQEDPEEIGRASCRERVEISVVAVSLKKKTDRPGGGRVSGAEVSREAGGPPHTRPGA